MKKLAATGHVWSEQNLRSWLANPQAVVPRTAMKFPGVPDEQHLNELLPLLKQATGG
jgi:cytochrome c2